MKQVQIEGKLYTLVSERIKELTKRRDEGKIRGYDFKSESELVTIGQAMGWKVEVTLRVIDNNMEKSEYDGSAFVIQDSTPYGKSALEWAETKARGRACSAYGIGADASAEEILIPNITKPDKKVEPTEHAEERLRMLNEIKAIPENPIMAGHTSTSGVVDFSAENEEAPQPVEAKEEPDTTEPKEEPLYTEDQLSAMGVSSDIYTLINYYNIDLNATDGRNTNKKLRKLILTAQQSREGYIADDIPKETKETKEPIEDTTEPVKIGSDTNFLGLEFLAETPRNIQVWFPQFEDVVNKLDVKKQELEARMKAMGMMEDYAKVSDLFEKGEVSLLNDLINSFQG